jgi:hypothetical protein
VDSVHRVALPGRRIGTVRSADRPRGASHCRNFSIIKLPYDPHLRSPMLSMRSAPIAKIICAATAIGSRRTGIGANFGLGLCSGSGSTESALSKATTKVSWIYQRGAHTCRACYKLVHVAYKYQPVLRNAVATNITKHAPAPTAMSHAPLTSTSATYTLPGLGHPGSGYESTATAHEPR